MKRNMRDFLWVQNEPVARVASASISRSISDRQNTIHEMGFDVALPRLGDGSRPMERIPLALAIDRLQLHYGIPKVPKLSGPWQMILWETVAYLADDDRRREAFQTLKNLVGTKPEQILSAADEALLQVTRHGIMAEHFADKLRQCARIVLEEFEGDLRPVLQWPLQKGKKALQKFPGIGEPGAEKVLLFTRTQPLLALESNGLRVLLRLGFGEENKSYSTTYRLVREAVTPELNTDYSWLIQAHQLLRLHGQELCRRSEPACEKCPLASECSFNLQR
jgi:endonuclease-3